MDLLKKGPKMIHRKSLHWKVLLGSSMVSFLVLFNFLSIKMTIGSASQHFLVCSGLTITTFPIQCHLVNSNSQIKETPQRCPFCPSWHKEDSIYLIKTNVYHPETDWRWKRRGVQSRQFMAPITTCAWIQCFCCAQAKQFSLRSGWVINPPRWEREVSSPSGWTDACFDVFQEMRSFRVVLNPEETSLAVSFPQAQEHPSNAPRETHRFGKKLFVVLV